MKKRAQPEFQLACQVADLFRRSLPPHVLWTHFPAGEARSEITGARLKRMGTGKGWPDYQILHNGRFIGIELKAPKGQISPDQEALGDAITAQGCAYTIARSIDAVEAFLIDQGVPLKARLS